MQLIRFLRVSTLNIAATMTLGSIFPTAIASMRTALFATVHTYSLALPIASNIHDHVIDSQLITSSSRVYRIKKEAVTGKISITKCTPMGVFVQARRARAMH